MGKYDSWNHFFSELSEDPYKVSFEELSRLIPGGLPPSAYKFEPWWGTGQHQAVWTRYGWRASPDLRSRTVRFTKSVPTAGRPEGSSDMTPVAQPVQVPADLGPRLILVGCVSKKLKRPAPAKDLYISPLWNKRRGHAEATGMPWAILSAEYGLVDPDEVIDPYDRYLGNEPRSYREAWSETTASQVIEKLRHLGMNAVEIHAGAEYVENGLSRILKEEGVAAGWPVRGLRFGEQLAWYGDSFDPEAQASPQDPLEDYRTEARALAASLRALANRIDNEVLGPGERREPSQPPLTAELEQRLVAVLLQHGEAHASIAAMTPDPDFTPDPAANAFVGSDPLAFLFAVIADYQITAERAWALPWELKKRLGHLDAERMLDDPQAIYAAFDRPPKLHRFIRNVPNFLLDACRIVLSEYGGDASRIWSDEPTARELQDRLVRFPGISQKKAAMAVEILERDLGVPIREMEGSDLAFDVHVRRVMLRTGLAWLDDQQHMIDRARALHPSRPGALDSPLWLIGRAWCHPGVPECDACVLVESCPKLIDAARGVRGK